MLDVVVAGVGLGAMSPVLGISCLLIWIDDRTSPFYRAVRVGRDGNPFTMTKLRSMVSGADAAGVSSTGADDQRITRIGHIVRRYKLDEAPQFWDVLRGEMSIVGPRPNVPVEVGRYTDIERRLLAVRPGMTDIASIVFSDEAEILRSSEDPNLDYNLLIRPWKSRLGLLYVEHRSLRLDLSLIGLTALSLLDRDAALRSVARLLRNLGADADLRRIALRQDPLQPSAPPGAEEPFAADG